MSAHPHPPPSGPVRVLTVCTGNICRSPYAELLLREGFGWARPGAFEVTSAGTHALVGRPVDVGSVRQLGAKGIDAGGNMAAPLLAESLGGTFFLGFIAAVAFATILAVVAGLTLAGASALSHDIYVSVIKHGHASEGEQVAVARATLKLTSIPLFRWSEPVLMVVPAVLTVLVWQMSQDAAPT